jgi:hypothetical protein
MASTIIGVLGKKRAGKDTFARRLVEAHGYTRLAFADALRDAALALDPIIRVDSDEYGLLPQDWCAEWARPYMIYRLSHLVSALGWEDAKAHPEVRRTLQNYGVAIRDLDPDFWVRVVMDQARDIDGPVVITDVRFPNEAEAVERASMRDVADIGRTVRVARPGIISDDTHISETALDSWTPDMTIPNAGTVEDLHRHADYVAERYGS